MDIKQKELYCPNLIFDSDNISIGEFNNVEQYMNFPIKELWFINRLEGNKFQEYKSQ